MASSFVQDFVKPFSIDVTSTLNRLNQQRAISELGTQNKTGEREDEDEETSNALVAVYVQSLKITISEALEAEREAEWWSDIERSRWNAFWYLVQTLPLRVHSLLESVRASVETGEDIVRRPQFTLASLFPHLRQSFSQPHLGIRRKELSSFRYLYYSLRKTFLIPLHYTFQEISIKRLQLLRIRDERAQALGELVLLRPQVQKIVGHVQASSGTNEALILIQRLLGLANPHFELGNDMASSLAQLSSSRSTVHTLGLSRPSRLTRLWPRLVFGPPFLLYTMYYLYSSRGTLLDFAKEAKDVIKGFVIDWCVKPLAGVLDTVKASKAEEGAGWLVTTEGVKADRDSLERMALSLASDHLHYTPTQLDELSTRIRLGDLTPVLKLYEEDIKSPVKNAVAGTLLRTVFIQVQKAKVDLDQALSGIDKLMKSQELTFAFVGLSPTLVILYILGGWVRRLLWPTNDAKEKYGGLKERKRIFWVMRRVERVLVLDQTSGKRGDTGSKTSQEIQKLRNDSEGSGQPSALTTGLLILSLTQLRAYAERYLPSAGSSSAASSPSSAVPVSPASVSTSAPPDSKPVPVSLTAIASSTSAPNEETSYSASSLREAFLEDVTDLQDPELGVDQKRAVVERMWRCWGGMLGWGGREY